MKTIDQLAKDHAFWNVPMFDRKPDPFAGRFPTRWRIVCTEAGVNLTSKPDPRLHGLFKRLCKDKKNQIYLVEFDRAGVFRATFPNAGRLRRDAIAYYYYPFSNYNDGFFAPWKKASLQTVDFGKADGRRIRVYVPDLDWQKNPGVQAVRLYREQLRKLGLFKQLDFVKLPKPPAQKRGPGGYFFCENCGTPFTNAFPVPSIQKSTCSHCWHINIIEV